MQEQASLREDLDRCARCGQCRTVCPVFQETNVETMVARGRISLAQAVVEGRLAYTRRLEEYIQSCLKCLRCAANCPSGVAYERILQEIRFAMGRDLGISPLARGVFRFLLPHRFLFDQAIKAARFAQMILPPAGRGQMRHLPLFFTGQRLIPNLARRSALKRLRGLPSDTRRKLRVVFFIGCLINYAYPDIAEAAVRVLRHLGVEVIVPQGQLCCGTPVLSFGDRTAAQRLAKHNAGVMLAETPDFVVTACASCGKTLKSDYISLVPHRGKEFAKKVLDVSELLSEIGFEKATRLSATVTYHDPCHLRWGQNVVTQPREILRGCARYVEMPEAERCCGGGGTFSLFHYDLACSIAAKKLEAINASGADIVTTNCPGCILHLSDRMGAAGMTTPILHTIQIVESALLGKELKWTRR